MNCVLFRVDFLSEIINQVFHIFWILSSRVDSQSSHLWTYRLNRSTNFDIFTISLGPCSVFFKHFNVFHQISTTLQQKMFHFNDLKIMPFHHFQLMEPSFEKYKPIMENLSALLIDVIVLNIEDGRGVLQLYSIRLIDVIVLNIEDGRSVLQLYSIRLIDVIVLNIEDGRSVLQLYSIRLEL